MCLATPFFLETCPSHILAIKHQAASFCSCCLWFDYGPVWDHSALWHLCLQEVLFNNTCEKCYGVGTHWKITSVSFQFRAVFKTKPRNRCTHRITPVESNQIKYCWQGQWKLFCCSKCVQGTEITGNHFNRKLVKAHYPSVISSAVPDGCFYRTTANT